MSDLQVVVIVVVCVAAGHGIAAAVRWIRSRGRRRVGDGAFSDPGVSVEVDCRGCGQFNRVPSHRLRDRPKCGCCKARLMPGKRVVLCRVTPMDRRLSAAYVKELDEDKMAATSACREETALRAIAFAFDAVAVFREARHKRR